MKLNLKRALMLLLLLGGLSICHESWGLIIKVVDDQTGKPIYDGMQESCPVIELKNNVAGVVYSSYVGADGVFSANTQDGDWSVVVKRDAKGYHRYETYSKIVSIMGGQPLQIEVRLKKLNKVDFTLITEFCPDGGSDCGEEIIRKEIMDAHITVGDKEITPGIYNLEFTAGEYEYKIKRDGYEQYTGNFTVDTLDQAHVVILQAKNKHKFNIAFTVIQENGDTLQNPGIIFEGSELDEDLVGKCIQKRASYRIDIPDTGEFIVNEIEVYKDTTIVVHLVKRKVALNILTHITYDSGDGASGDHRITKARVKIEDENFTPGIHEFELYEGKYKFSVEADGYRSATEIIQIYGDTVYSIYLTQLENQVFHVEYLAQDEEGRPLPDCKLVINGQEEPDREFVTPSCRMIYEFSKDGYRTQKDTLYVVEDTMLRITVKKYFNLNFVLKDESGINVEGARIFLSGTDYNGTSVGYTNIQVVREPYFYRIRHNNYLEMTREDMVVRGDTTIELTLYTPRILRFQLKNEVGNLTDRGTFIIKGPYHETKQKDNLVFENMWPFKELPFEFHATGYEPLTGTVSVHKTGDTTFIMDAIPLWEDVTITVSYNLDQPESERTFVAGAHINIYGQSLTTDAEGKVNVRLPHREHTYTGMATHMVLNPGKISVDSLHHRFNIEVIPDLPLTFTELVLNDRSLVCLHPEVPVSFRYTGGYYDSYRIGEEPDLSDAVWKSRGVDKAPFMHSFSNLNPGVKYLYAQLRNRHGVTEILAARIFYKSTPERLSANITVNGGAAETKSAHVYLEIEAENGFPLYYSVGEEPEDIGTEWNVFTERISYTLSEGAGMKTIYLAVANDDEVSAISTTSIYYDESETVKDGGLEATLYPNPVHTTLHVEVSDKASLFKVEIYSVTGGLLGRLEYDSPSFEVDLSAYPGGIYLLRISGGRNYVVKRIIKQ